MCIVYLAVRETEYESISIFTSVNTTANVVTAKDIPRDQSGLCMCISLCDRSVVWKAQATGFS